MLRDKEITDVLLALLATSPAIEPGFQLTLQHNKKQRVFELDFRVNPGAGIKRTVSEREQCYDEDALGRVLREGAESFARIAETKIHEHQKTPGIKDQGKPDATGRR